MPGLHRLPLMLKQQSSIIIYRLPTKENELSLSVFRNKLKFALSIFRLQQTKKVAVCIYRHVYVFIQYRYIYIYIYISINL
jgi:hypothetical protein